MATKKVKQPEGKSSLTYFEATAELAKLLTAMDEVRNKTNVKNAKLKTGKHINVELTKAYRELNTNYTQLLKRIFAWPIGMIELMLEWIKLQKNEAVKAGNYRLVANLRLIEKTLLNRNDNHNPLREPEKRMRKAVYRDGEQPDLDYEGKRQREVYQEANKALNKNAGQQTNGRVIMGTPVHLLDEDIRVINPEARERDQIVHVKKSARNPYRKFDGAYHRHCSKCPFPEGCVMCCLP